MTPEEQKAVQLLRRLILGQDDLKLDEIQDQLQTLRERIVDKEALLSSLDPVIADLLERKIGRSKEDMAQALAPVMSEAIRKQAQDTKEDVVDALYPVIGETIRKSIAEALRDLVTSVNVRIENAFVRKLLPRRLQARLLGIPYGQLLVKEVLPFKIDQLFMVHKDTGLLIGYASSKQSGPRVDEQLIGAMLTAIRDFVAEAFQQDSSRDLSEIQYGNSKIRLHFDRFFYLAAVVSGNESIEFSAHLERQARKLHNLFYIELRNFDGELTQLEGVETELAHFITTENQPQKRRNRTYRVKPYLKYFALGTLFLLVVFSAFTCGFSFYSDYRLKSAVQQDLQAQGTTFQNVGIEVNDGRIAVQGSVASYRQILKLDSLLSRYADSQVIDNRVSILLLPPDPEKVLLQIEDKIRDFRTKRFFNPRFVLDRDVLHINGFVQSLSAKKDLGFLVSEIQGIRLVHNAAWVLNETELADARIYLHDNTIFFAHDSLTVSDDQMAKIENVVALYQQFEGIDLKLIVRGFSSDNKSFYRNLRTSKIRAQAVAEILQSFHIASDDIVVVYYGSKYPIMALETENWGWSRNTRVEFDLIEGDQAFETAGHYQ
ncbi:OmpA family protein [candidate division KSB1 bacterium]|nr:OmpA family protein [candidate division KSB1 bacterium]